MRSTPLRILSASPRVLYYDRTPYFSHFVRVSRICATALPFTRMMSSSPTKHLFAVYAPDYTDPGVLERRFSVREKHLKGIDGMLDSGIMKFGGALLAPELTDECGRKKMTGSLMFYEAESIEEVRKIVKSDIYYTSGVWNRENVVIAPFVTAMHWPST